MVHSSAPCAPSPLVLGLPTIARSLPCSREESADSLVVAQLLPCGDERALACRRPPFETHPRCLTVLMPSWFVFLYYLVVIPALNAGMRGRESKTDRVLLAVMLSAVSRAVVVSKRLSAE